MSHFAGWPWWISANKQNGIQRTVFKERHSKNSAFSLCKFTDSTITPLLLTFRQWLTLLQRLLASIWHGMGKLTLRPGGLASYLVSVHRYRVQSTCVIRARGEIDKGNLDFLLYSVWGEERWEETRRPLHHRNIVSYPVLPVIDILAWSSRGTRGKRHKRLLIIELMTWADFSLRFQGNFSRRTRLLSCNTTFLEDFFCLSLNLVELLFLN